MLSTHSLRIENNTCTRMRSKLEFNCVRPVIHFGTKPQAMRQERVNTDAWGTT